MQNNISADGTGLAARCSGTGSPLVLDEVGKLLPKARVHCLAGQRHMAPMFDPTGLARAILSFTSAHDN